MKDASDLFGAWLEEEDDGFEGAVDDLRYSRMGG